MIVRIARFAPMTPEVEAEARRNLVERFKPALSTQPGFITAYWTTTDDGRWVSAPRGRAWRRWRRAGRRQTRCRCCRGKTPTRSRRPSRLRRSRSWPTRRRAGAVSGHAPLPANGIAATCHGRRWTSVSSAGSCTCACSPGKWSARSPCRPRIRTCGRGRRAVSVSAYPRRPA